MPLELATVAVARLFVVPDVYAVCCLNVITLSSVPPPATAMENTNVIPLAYCKLNRLPVAPAVFRSTTAKPRPMSNRRPSARCAAIAAILPSRTAGWPYSGTVPVRARACTRPESNRLNPPLLTLDRRSDDHEDGSGTWHRVGVRRFRESPSAPMPADGSCAEAPIRLRQRAALKDQLRTSLHGDERAQRRAVVVRREGAQQPRPAVVACDGAEGRLVRRELDVRAGVDGHVLVVAHQVHAPVDEGQVTL